MHHAEHLLPHVTDALDVAIGWEGCGIDNAAHLVEAELLAALADVFATVAEVSDGALLAELLEVLQVVMLHHLARIIIIATDKHAADAFEPRQEGSQALIGLGRCTVGWRNDGLVTCGEKREDVFLSFGHD